MTVKIQEFINAKLVEIDDKREQIDSLKKDISLLEECVANPSDFLEFLSSKSNLAVMALYNMFLSESEKADNHIHSLQASHQAKLTQYDKEILEQKLQLRQILSRLDDDIKINKDSLASSLKQTKVPYRSSLDATDKEKSLDEKNASVSTDPDKKKPAQLDDEIVYGHRLSASIASAPVPEAKQPLNQESKEVNGDTDKKKDLESSTTGRPILTTQEDQAGVPGQREYEEDKAGRVFESSDSVQPHEDHKSVSVQREYEEDQAGRAFESLRHEDETAEHVDDDLEQVKESLQDEQVSITKESVGYWDDDLSIEKQLVETSGDEEANIEAEDEPFKYSFIVGKFAGEPLLDESGKLIIAKDEIITEEVAAKAESEGKLVSLIIDMKFA